MVYFNYGQNVSQAKHTRPMFVCKTREKAEEYIKTYEIANKMLGISKIWIEKTPCYPLDE